MSTYEGEASTTEPAQKIYSDDDILKMWPQAEAELSGFARHLNRTGAGITAAQLRMALQLAKTQFEAIKDKSNDVNFQRKIMSSMRDE